MTGYSKKDKKSNLRNALYFLLALFLLYFMYTMKFLFEERFEARQNIVFEETGRRNRKKNTLASHLRNPVLREMEEEALKQNVFRFDVLDIEGNEINLGESFAGKFKVMLIVNVASECGKTLKNYEQLQTLYEKYHSAGLEIIAFPCNQFKNQEPASNQEIERFARDDRKVTFPLMSKLDVNGESANDLFVFLRDQTMNGKSIRWNFAKFLVDSQGQPIIAYDPKIYPNDMESQIKLLLDANSKQR